MQCEKRRGWSVITCGSPQKKVKLNPHLTLETKINTLNHTPNEEDSTTNLKITKEHLHCIRLAGISPYRSIQYVEEKLTD